MADLPKLNKRYYILEMMSTIIYTCNVNCTRYVENGYASKSFEGFKFINRLDALISDTTKENPNIIGFCEADKIAKKLLEDRLFLEGYTIVTNSLPQAYAPYQEPDMSFYYIIAYKGVSLLDSQMVWFTSTPSVPLTLAARKTDPVLLEHKDPFERGSLLCTFSDTRGKFIYSINHFSLRDTYQQAGAQILCDVIDKLMNEQLISRTVVAGDFNTFPRDDKPDMRALDKMQGYNVCQDGNNDTFCGCPYDLGLPTPTSTAHLNNVLLKIEDPIQQRLAFVSYILELHGKPIMSKLDWILTKGITEYKCYSTPVFGSAKDVAELLTESCRTGKPHTSSDHAATVIIF